MADDISFSAVLDTGNFDAGMAVLTGALFEVGSIAVDSFLAAGAAVADFVGDSFAGAIEAEQGFARLTAQILAQGDAAAVTADQAALLADEYKHLAGGSDDAIIAAEAVLLKFNAIGSETFPLAIEQSANLAALMGTDVATAAQTLGLALDDPTMSLARLDKATGAFTAAEKEQIEAMAKAGDVAGAQALILANLEEAIGGTAETLGATTAGQWAIFQETIADAGESVMSSLLPALTMLMEMVLIPLVPIVEDVAATLSRFIEVMIGSGLDQAFAVFEDGSSYIGAVAEALGFSEEQGNAFGVVANNIYTAIVESWPLIQSTAETVFTAVQSVMQVLGDFITITLMPAIASIWEQSGAQLPTAQQTFESVMSAIVAATEIVASFITTVLVPAFTTAVDWVVANWPQIQAVIEQVWAAIQTVIDLEVAYLTNIVIPAFMSVVDWVVTNWPTIQATIEAVMAAVQAVIDAVMTYVAPFVIEKFNEIKAWVDANWPLIQATIDTVINAISSDITTVVTGITAFWTEHHNTIMAVASAIWETIKLNINSAITLIEGILKTTMQIITGDWSGAWTTIGETAATIWANIQTQIDTTIGAIAAVIAAVVADIKATWEANWNNIKLIVYTVAADILANIIQTVGDMAAAFSAIDWIAVGSTLINSIKQGVIDATGALVQSAIDAAMSAYNAVIDALQGGSPFQLFIEVGENTQESMAIGIENSAHLAVEAAEDAARAVGDVAIEVSAEMGELAGEAFVDPYILEMQQIQAMHDAASAAMYDVGETAIEASYEMGEAAGEAFVDPYVLEMQAIQAQHDAASAVAAGCAEAVAVAAECGEQTGIAFTEPYVTGIEQAADAQHYVYEEMLGIGQGFTEATYTQGLAAGQAFADPYTAGLVAATEEQDYALGVMIESQKEFTENTYGLGLQAGQSFTEPYTTGLVAAQETQEYTTGLMIESEQALVAASEETSNAIQLALGAAMNTMGLTVQQIDASAADIWNVLTSPDWYAIGVNIIDAVSAGISNTAPALAVEAQNAAIGAYNASIDVLGIASDSKLFTAIGENVMGAMAHAIQKNASLPAGAMQHAAGALIAPVQAATHAIANNSNVSTTDARQFVLNASTGKPMQTVQAEFTTMQTMAGLP